MTPHATCPPPQGVYRDCQEELQQCQRRLQELIGLSGQAAELETARREVEVAARAVQEAGCDMEEARDQKRCYIEQLVHMVRHTQVQQERTFASVFPQLMANHTTSPAKKAARFLQSWVGV